VARSASSSGRLDLVVANVKFGWLCPVAGHEGSNFQPIVMCQEEHILPQPLPHFDSVWIADHFYGFDPDKKEGFLEGWTTLTWLAAKFPDVMLCHHVRVYERFWGDRLDALEALFQADPNPEPEDR
jgi:hypothetical protein